jgi:hypothetical protein
MPSNLKCFENHLYAFLPKEAKFQNPLVLQDLNEIPQEEMVLGDLYV